MNDKPQIEEEPQPQVQTPKRPEPTPMPDETKAWDPDRPLPKVAPKEESDQS